MEPVEDERPEFSKLRIFKNLTLLSMSYLLVFTAYNGLSMLQTTMNKAEGIGTISQAAIYILYGLSSLFLSSYVVEKLGTKGSLITGMACFVPYIASNFYPSWLIMIPSAMLLGFGTTIMWAAQGTYINKCSKMYCALDKNDNAIKPPKDKIHKESKCKNGKRISSVEEMSGHNITQDIHQKPTKDIKVDTSPESAIISKENNLPSNNSKEEVRHWFEISKKNASKFTKKFDSHKDNNCQSSMKSNGEKKEASCNQFSDTYFDNMQKQRQVSSIGNINAMFFGFHFLLYSSSQIWSNLLSFYVLRSDGNVTSNNLPNCSCGPDYCNTDSECFSTDTKEISNYTRYLLTGICIVFAGCAVLLNLLLDALKEKKEAVTFSLSHVLATAKFSRRKEPILLIPLTLYAGMCQGFYTADFTKSYIGCAWSTSHIGLVTVFYGLASAVSSLLSGYVIKFVGRRSVFILCHAVNVVNLVFMLIWRPEPQQSLLFYLAGSLWGFTVGIVMAQLRAFYGVLFQGEEETAFASFNMYCGLGSASHVKEINCSSNKYFDRPYEIICDEFQKFLLYILENRDCSDVARED
ncbi:UNC93-like protein [Caerostris extrusa]|uniref:UNC93-like protein n=1 Tax=Caerostris extrusa TaxID=172846 RepID=A0AAV4XRU5_CAEEX|nr:UNC93-like protein [Caerostris extrusa]